MCISNRLLDGINSSFENKINDIDKSKFTDFEVVNNEIVDKIDLNNFINNWINKDGWHHFHTDTKESYFRKILSNSWDFIIDWSIGLGNQHFAITINMPLEIVDGIHLDDYESFTYDDYESLESKIKNHVLENFKTTTFLFIVAEKNEKGVLHFHILISIRNFIDYNYVLKNKKYQLKM